MSAARSKPSWRPPVVTLRRHRSSQKNQHFARIRLILNDKYRVAFERPRPIAAGSDRLTVRQLRQRKRHRESRTLPSLAFCMYYTACLSPDLNVEARARADVRRDGPAPLTPA